MARRAITLRPSGRPDTRQESTAAGPKGNTSPPSIFANAGCRDVNMRESLNRVSLRWMLTGDEAKAAEADNLQAQLLRECLAEERREAAKLAKHAQMLNECTATTESRTISHHRGSIRQLEHEIWSINQIVDALNARFPAPGSAGELS
jgi:hypothetical protein